MLIFNKSSSLIVSFRNGIKTSFISILGLFFPCCPSAITRFIVTIRINSLNSVFTCRTFTHIGKKINERFLPTLAYCYASATIKIISWFIWVKTSGLHGNPSSVFISFKSSIFGGSMFSNFFNMITSTRTMLTRSKVISYSNRCISTMTDTFPRSFFANIGSYFNNSKILELFSNQVKFFHGKIIAYNIVIVKEVM